MNNLIEFLKEDVLFFDVLFILIIFYNLVKCYNDGFSLSFLSSLKWLVSIVATIILVPKFQPYISDHIESDFIHNVGIGVLVFVITLFVSIVMGKAIGRTIFWTGLGSVDKYFGIIFGLFKGYIVAVCLFSLFNWFYAYEKLNMSTSNSLSFELIMKGRDLIINEFPNYDDLIDTKEKIEKI